MQRRYAAPVVTQPSRAAIRQRILRGARDLFQANGIRSVTMTDVARQADCSRQLVYKVFFDRRELILAAAVERISEIADEATVAIPARSLEDAFVDRSVRIIEQLRNDPELGSLLGEESPVTLHTALWAPELVNRAMQFWRPWLETGRTRGMLRTDLSDADLADWLHTVYASIVLRLDIPEERERAMIQRFVLTSLAMTNTPASETD